jgi:DNA-nicking Smr family endonuclease
MSRRRPRTLDARERALWSEVVKTASPMRKVTAPRPPEETAARPAPAEPPEIPTLEPFRIGERAQAATVVVPPGRTPHLRMDKRAYTQLRRGKARPEARIDLHGMTVAAAHSALTAFLMRAYSDEKRLVLVITGKGRGGDDGGPVPEARGILRRQVPHWLEVPPLSQIVLQTVEAHQRHGGSGALYVYLRRR